MSTRGETTLPATGFVLLALITVFWGVTFPIIKLALREIDLWVFRVICLTVGAAGIFTIARAAGQRLAVPAADRPALALAALLNITGWHLFSAYALTMMPAGRAAILAYTMPLWVVLLGRIVLGESLSRGRVAGLTLGLGGIALLGGDDLLKLGAAPWGALAIVMAAMSWAAGTVVIKSRQWSVGSGALTAWQMVVGGVPVLIGALAVGVLPDPAAISATAWAATAFTAVIPMVFCHWAWTRIVALFPAGLAAIGTLAIPAVGVAASVPLAGEPLGWREVLALVLVVGGLAVVFLGPARAAWARSGVAGGRSGA